MAIFPKNDPILKAQLPSTPLGFSANRRSTATPSPFLPILPSNPKFLPWQQSHHCGIETGSRAKNGSRCFPEQQSHHCGIETPQKEEIFRDCSSSNSTIVGLKPFSRSTNENYRTGSNRTIVGLKPGSGAVAYDTWRWQQSHHCGIETTGLLRLMRW